MKKLLICLALLCIFPLIFSACFSKQGAVTAEETVVKEIVKHVFTIDAGYHNNSSIRDEITKLNRGNRAARSDRTSKHCLRRSSTHRLSCSECASVTAHHPGCFLFPSFCCIVYLFSLQKQETVSTIKKEMLVLKAQVERG